MMKTLIQRLLVTLLTLTFTGGFAIAADENTEDTTTARQSTMIVLDGSNSMWGQLQGINKIVTARESLETLLENANDSINFGLLTYGNKRKTSCNDLTVVSKPEDYDKKKMLKNIRRMNPRGRSPIADALKKAADSLPADNAHILLVSDGEESCGGDPCAMARSLREANPSLQIDVIGFRAEKEAQLECIAENGNGAFVVADNMERVKTLLAGVRAKAQNIAAQSGDTTLPGSLEASMRPSTSQTEAPRANYSIYTLDGNNVASFTARTQIKEYLEPGTYRIKAILDGREISETVTIQSGKNQTLEFAAEQPGLLRVSAVDDQQNPVQVNYSVYLQNGDFVSRHVLQNQLEARVSPGDYRVKADFAGKKQEIRFSVQSNVITSHVFRFD